MAETAKIHFPRGRSLFRALALVALVAVLVGCSSAKRENATVADAGDRGSSSAAQVRPPAEIASLDVADSADGAAVRMQADRPLVWTSFRNTEGDLVIELPNSVAGASIGDLAPVDGLVQSVQVEQLEDGDRPLTRMTVRTREPNEHSLVGDGNSLTLELMLIGGGQDVTLAYEPIEEEAPEPEMARDRSERVDDVRTASSPAGTNGHGIPQTYGTPEAPQIGPAPVGPAASQLYEVTVVESGSSTQVRVEGDGEFAYSTFRLQNPERFVVDLEGVVNTGARSTITVATGSVEQIRVGQFKPRPEPVSRVVFDLAGFEVPTVTRTPRGLVISFGDNLTPPETSLASADEPVETYEPMESDLAGDDSMAPDAAVADTSISDSMVTDSGIDTAADDEMTSSMQVAESSPPPSVPVYEPPPAPRAATGTPSDVALFEAQQVDVNEPGERRDRILESFGAIAVSKSEREYLGEPISMSLRNADLVETLRSFAKISDLNFVIQPGVRGSVTVELKSVPWDQAMEQILRLNNLGMDIDGTIVRIAPLSMLQQEAELEARLRQARAQSTPLRTVMRSLSYARATDIAQVLRRSTASQLLSDRASLEVYAPTNTLIISELPERIDTVLAVIDNLETPPPQVTIEARIIDATKNFSRTLGIQWGYDLTADQANGNTTGLIFPNNVQSDGGVGLLTGGANGFLNLSMGNILDTFRLNASLQVAENEGLINVVSAPRVTTINNSAATIQSGFQIPVQTVTNRTVSVQFVNATLQLRVIPYVTAEGTVLLDINVAKRFPEFGLQVPGATGPPIATKEAATRVLVRDGATVVIGGIYEVQTDQGRDSVPGLANIPILGHLFRNKDRNDSNTELMIFITPRIVQI